MTRINSAIPPRCLTDEHLLAEHREIKRLPYFLRCAMLSGSTGRIPERFTLGHGHVLFFIDKQQFIYDRYIKVHWALRNRGYNVHTFISSWDAVPQAYWNEYTPTCEERDLLVARITERIMNSKKQTWHYYGQPITKERAVQLLHSAELYR